MKPSARRRIDNFVCTMTLGFCGLLAVACGGSSSGPVAAPTTSALGLFDTVWNDFDASYSFFDLKGIDWNDSRTTFLSQLTSTSTDAQLFTVLSNMLLELEDPCSANHSTG